MVERENKEAWRRCKKATWVLDKGGRNGSQPTRRGREKKARAFHGTRRVILARVAYAPGRRTDPAGFLRGQGRKKERQGCDAKATARAREQEPGGSKQGSS
jgi:hypothetical protein